MLPLRPRLPRRAAAALAPLFSTLAACSSAPSQDSGDVAAASEAMTRGASTCPVSATFGVITFVAPDAPVVCPTIAGHDGAWVGSEEYPALACAPTRDPSLGVGVFCTYDWTPSARHPGAAPDEGALDAIPDAYVAPFGHGGETTCDATSALPHAALLDAAGVSCPPRPHHPDGPAACTVCNHPLPPGVRRAMLALPASSTLRTVTVGLSNGTTRVVTFDTSAAASSAASRRPGASPWVDVPLPALPVGLRYVDGPVGGYGYGHEHP